MSDTPRADRFLDLLAEPESGEVNDVLARLCDGGAPPSDQERGELEELLKLYEERVE
jgi:hypothetical protein